jgi:hypothetical protein
MSADPFKLAIHTTEKTAVYLSCVEGSQLSWQLVRLLDQASIRVVGDLPKLGPDGRRIERIMAGCAGIVSVLAYPPGSSTLEARLLEELRQCVALDLPVALFVDKNVRLDYAKGQDGFRFQIGSSGPLFIGADLLHGPTFYLDDAIDENVLATATDFQDIVLRERDRIQPYAFFVGRLERDFAQARHAIRAAVESEAGIPCLWSDDGRHMTNVASIRDRTRLLIKHASFIIADLTLGFESPKQENPSRAHEIGMAIAYDRHTMLCSQEPRRYPYFSVGDMQMTFWATEAELAGCVRDWIRAHSSVLGRQVFNYRLPVVYPGCEPQIEKTAFDFDPAKRYVGPTREIRAPFRIRRAVLTICSVGFLLVLVLLTLAIVWHWSA